MKNLLKFTALCLSVFIIATTLFYTIENRRGARAWQKTLAELKAKGHPVTIADTIPPPIPDEDNVAAAPIFAELFTPDGDKNPDARLLKVKPDYSAKILLNVHKGELDDLPEKQTARDLLTQLNEWSPLFAEVEEALQRPQCRWPLVYEKGFFTPMPQATASLDLAKALHLRSLCRLTLGDSASATDDLLVMYRLAEVNESPAYLINLLLSGAIQNMVSSVVWSGCVQNLWQEKDLQRLQAAIPAGKNLPMLGIAFQNEQATFFFISEQLNKKFWLFNTKAFKEIDNIFGKISRSAVFLYGLRPHGWGDLERMKYVTFTHNLTRSDTDTEKYRAFERVIDQERTPVKILAAPLTFLTLPGLIFVPQKICRTEITNHQALIACALARYKIRHGKLPDTLSRLVPEYLEKIPDQVILNEPMFYRRVNDQDYLLYAVGWDLQDHGGVISDDRLAKKLDQVWASNPNLYQRARKGINGAQHE